MRMPEQFFTARGAARGSSRREQAHIAPHLRSEDEACRRRRGSALALQKASRADAAAASKDRTHGRYQNE